MRLAVFLFVVLSFISLAALAQQPQLLGSIPSDTINSLFGTQIVPMGDQNNDGNSDILIWDYREAAGLYLGGNSIDFNPTLKLKGILQPIGLPGLVNADGYLDLIVEGSFGGPNRAKLFYGGPSIDTVVDFSFGVDSLSGFHLFMVVSPDVNQNGSSELITQEHFTTSKQLVFYELDFPLDSVPDLIFGPPDELQPFRAFGERIALGDFNGDSQSDIAVNWRPVEDTVSGAALIYFGGSLFDTIPDVIIRRPSGLAGFKAQFAYDVLCAPGDINGDGWDDLIIASGLTFDDTLTFVYFGGPSLDTIPDLTIVEKIDVVSGVGDVNNDGYADFMAGRPYSFGGFVSLYYGGPSLDSLNDFRVWDSDIPGFTTYVGMDVTGIGDYNGDGIDDFAFSAVDNQKGTVYIYAGFQDPTDVPYDYEPTLPSSFELAQNYPNPFNPSTTISFALPAAGATELSIYNVLGEKVKTLIDRRLSAGSYTLQWDGKNATGNPVASGVYVYRLRSGEFVTSKKMMLVR